MWRYVVKRVLLSIVTLWLLATIVFLMTWALPSDPARLILGAQAPEQSVAAFRVRFGLNDSVFVQYGRLLKGLVTFDFGESWKYPTQQVWDYLSPPLAKTAKLAALAMIITAPISVGAGLIAAKFRDRKLLSFRAVHRFKQFELQAKSDGKQRAGDELGNRGRGESN